jgi:hypothetical protein
MKRSIMCILVMNIVNVIVVYGYFCAVGQVGSVFFFG